MSEGICNHLTVKAPSLKQKDPVVLIIPYGTYWSEVTPECLIGKWKRVLFGDFFLLESSTCILTDISTEIYLF